MHCFPKSPFKAPGIEEAVDQKDGRTPEIRLVLNSCVEIKNNDGTYIIPIQLQGCIYCAILLSGIGARGVSSEHLETPLEKRSPGEE